MFDLDWERFIRFHEEYFPLPDYIPNSFSDCFIRGIMRPPACVMYFVKTILNQTKPYIYVKDLVEAIVDFTNDIKPGVEIYNLGVLGATSVIKIADIALSPAYHHIRQRLMQRKFF